jgi:hypothetical protein
MHLERGGSCCGTLPDKTNGPGRLYLLLLSGHNVEKLYRYLRDAGWSCQIDKEDRCIVVRLDGEGSYNLFDGLSSLLTALEFEDTKALFKPGSEEPSVRAFPEVRPISRLAALGRAGWLLNMLSEERLTSFFQPIVWTFCSFAKGLGVRDPKEGPESPIPLLLPPAKENRKESGCGLSGRAASRERTGFWGGTHWLRTGSRSGYVGGPRHRRAGERAGGHDGEPGVCGLSGARQGASLQSYVGGGHRRGSRRNGLGGMHR